MTEKRPLQKIPVRDVQDVADVLFKNSELPKEILTPVKLPEIKRVEPTITPLEQFWAWLNYYVQGEIVKGTKGEPVANPFALISFATNWWRWVLGGIVIVVLVFAIEKLF